MRGRKPASKRSRNTVRDKLRYIQYILDKAGPKDRRNRDAAEILTSVPWLKLPRRFVPVPNVPSIDQLEALYAAAVGADVPRLPGFKPPAWWRALIVVTLCTGFRRRTLFSLSMSDVRWEDCCIRLRPELVKNEVGRHVPLNRSSIAHLLEIRTDRERLFEWPHDRTHFYTVLKKLQNDAGIPPADRFGLHAIRKAHATMLWKVSPQAAQYSLGHASIGTTLGSYVNCDDAVREAIEQMGESFPRR